jgi:hypothetical protein
VDVAAQCGWEGHGAAGEAGPRDIGLMPLIKVAPESSPLVLVDPPGVGRRGPCPAAARSSRLGAPHHAAPSRHPYSAPSHVIPLITPAEPTGGVAICSGSCSLRYHPPLRLQPMICPSRDSSTSTQASAEAPYRPSSKANANAHPFAAESEPVPGKLVGSRTDERTRTAAGSGRRP